MKLAHVLSAAVLCTAAARAGDESLLPLRTSTTVVRADDSAARLGDQRADGRHSLRALRARRGDRMRAFDFGDLGCDRRV